MNNNHERILDRSQYSKKSLDTFEILAAYFIDIYYNHLFIEGKKLRTNKSVTSITEGYKHALNAFIQGIENPKSYKKILVGIHSFFLSSGFTSISFPDCIEKITEEFIPKDYYASVSKQQKISILKLIIGQANKVFIERLVKNFLKLVIDTHSDADNIRVLQDVFIDILMIERENIYHRFISTQTKNDRAAPQTALVEAMQNEIKKLCGEKFELKKLTTSLKKIIINKENNIRNNLDEINNFKYEIDDLKKKLSRTTNPSHAFSNTMAASIYREKSPIDREPYAVKNIDLPYVREMRDAQQKSEIQNDDFENELEFNTQMFTDKTVAQNLSDIQSDIRSNRSDHSSRSNMFATDDF